jgi:hypothetical protein
MPLKKNEDSKKNQVKDKVFTKTQGAPPKF